MKMRNVNIIKQQKFGLKVNREGRKIIIVAGSRAGSQSGGTANKNTFLNRTMANEYYKAGERIGVVVWLPEGENGNYIPFYWADNHRDELVPYTAPNKYVKLSEKAQPKGVATLDDSGKVPNEQLPDWNNVEYFTDLKPLPETGVEYKIYINKDTEQCFFWNGKGYRQLGYTRNQSSSLFAKKNHTHNELHEHQNKDVLDGISSEKISAWDNKADKDAENISSENVEKWREKLNITPTATGNNF